MCVFLLFENTFGLRIWVQLAWNGKKLVWNGMNLTLNGMDLASNGTNSE